MRLRRSTIMLRTLLILPAAAMPASGQEHIDWETSLAGGARIFDLTWRTAAAPTSNDANPPFTASWKNITAAEETVGLCVHNEWLQLRGAVTYGRIIAGNSSMTAFADDSRQQVTYHSDQRSDGGDAYEGTLALGLRWSNFADTLFAVYEVGYTRSDQHLTLTDGVESVPTSGAYAGLDSTYHAAWQGPWLGAQGSWEFRRSWTLFANCRYQWVGYRGELDLNLRSDLAHPRSIEQDAQGYAVIVGLGVGYQLGWKTACRLQLSHEDSRTADGHDRVNYANGGADDVHLDDANLSAWTLRFGLTWEY